MELIQQFFLSIAAICMGLVIAVGLVVGGKKDDFDDLV